MSKTTPIAGGDSGDSRVSRELKALRKLKAPWYLEAELQKRLRFRGHRLSAAGFLAKPLPAYALSGVALVVLLVVGYNTFFRVGPVQDQISPASGNAQGSMEQSHVPLPPSSQKPPVLPRESVLMPDKEQRGPSPSAGDATIPSKIVDRRPAGKAAKIQDTTRTDSTKFIETAKDSLTPTQDESDTTVSD